MIPGDCGEHPASTLELELAATASISDVHTVALAELLAQHRENILRPFIELQRDVAALGEAGIAAQLNDIIDAARGIT